MSEWTADDEYLSLRKAVLRHGDPSAILASLERLLELRAAPVAGEGLDPYRNADVHERQSMAGTHNFDPHCPFCFLAHFDAETRAELAANQPVAEERP